MFSFFVGMFFGILIIDVVNSANLVVKLKRFAEENEIIVLYEDLKNHILAAHKKHKIKYLFFRPFREIRPLNEFLTEMKDSLNEQKERIENAQKAIRKKGRRK